MWHNELPVSSASQYAQWCVFRLARQHGVIVLLDGQGADELLGGYEQYFRAYVAESRATAAERSAIRQRYPLALPSTTETVKTSLPPALRRLLAGVTGKGSDVSFGIDREWAGRIAPSARAGHPGLSGLRAVLFQESFHTVLPTLLRYGDRNSMAHSIEVRLPFCDHRLAEFVFGLPADFLMGDVQTKRLLREAMRGLLPESVRTRWNKQGFVPPQDLWIRKRLIDEIGAMVEDRAFAERGYWNVAWWRGAVRRARAGERGLATTLWKGFIAEAWQRHFVDRVRHQEKFSVFHDPVRYARDLRQSLSS
jgi:asparagine synthase (glutamine-hydrolysing)